MVEHVTGPGASSTISAWAGDSDNDGIIQCQDHCPYDDLEEDDPFADFSVFGRFFALENYEEGCVEDIVQGVDLCPNDDNKLYPSDVEL